MALETMHPATPQPPGGTPGDDPELVAARRLVDALIARSHRRIHATLADDVHFRYLVPRGPAELDGANATADKFHAWFADADTVEPLAVHADHVADRVSLRYRLRVHRADGWKTIEQQVYAAVDASGRLAAIDLLCSGFRAADEADAVRDTSLPGPVAATVHDLDAGTMGCADGLADVFRHRIDALAPGDVLVVTAGDPAAKEDLPPLARMLGHTLRAVETTPDGRTMFTVERGQ